MNTLFTIELTINLPDSGRHARKLLNLYFSGMPADISQTAFDLCGADAAVQARRFAKPTLKRAEAWTSPEGSLKAFALLSVYGEDAPFVQQVIARYMQGFSDCLKRAVGRYFTEVSFPPEISLQPTDWTAEVHRA